MLAATRTARSLIRSRRRANQKRTIATHVRRAGADTTTVERVTAALRKTARTLRLTGQLGKVQTRTEKVTDDGVTGKVYRYTAAQIARIAGLYKPRKEAYRLVAEQLRLAA